MNEESITVQFTEEQLKIISSDLQAACYERCGLKKLYGKSKKAVIKSLEKQIKDREILVDIIEEKLKK